MFQMTEQFSRIYSHVPVLVVLPIVTRRIGGETLLDLIQKLIGLCFEFDGGVAEIKYFVVKKFFGPNLCV